MVGGSTVKNTEQVLCLSLLFFTSKSELSIMSWC